VTSFPVRPIGDIDSMRRTTFLVVYYAFLPVGYAQAWLAREFRRHGVELGWPLLVLWWPLRQLYVAGFRLCCVLLP
jgi:uncharacterized membrane protein (DUF485 family)